MPVQNQDGSVQFVANLSEKEIQAVLQFGLNMALAMGVASHLIEQKIPTDATAH